MINDEFYRSISVNSKPSETVVVTVTRYFGGRNLCTFFQCPHMERRRRQNKFTENDALT